MDTHSQSLRRSDITTFTRLYIYTSSPSASSSIRLTSLQPQPTHVNLTTNPQPRNTYPPANTPFRQKTAKMKRNIVIFVIIIVLFILLAMIAYGIYFIQNRVAVARQAQSESESGMSEIAP